MATVKYIVEIRDADLKPLASSGVKHHTYHDAEVELAQCLYSDIATHPAEPTFYYRIVPVVA